MSTPRLQKRRPNQHDERLRCSSRHNHTCRIRTFFSVYRCVFSAASLLIAHVMRLHLYLFVSLISQHYNIAFTTSMLTNVLVLDDGKIQSVTIVRKCEDPQSLTSSYEIKRFIQSQIFNFPFFLYLYVITIPSLIFSSGP